MVIRMENAFHGASNLVGRAIDAPNLSMVASMKNMFRGASKFNQDIGGWGVSSVTNMAHMFDLAAAFDQNLGNWDVSLVTDFAFMFGQFVHGMPDVMISTENYEKLLIGWAKRNLQDDQRLNVGTAKYCSVESIIARAMIIASHRWTIEDGGLCHDSIITPTITANGGAALYPITLNENIQSVATITAVGTDGDTLTYSLFGFDSALFNITQSGMLTFKSEFIPDYENPRDADGNIDNNQDQIYFTNVRVTDPHGLSDEQEVRVTIRDVTSEPPAVITLSTTTVTYNAPADMLVGTLSKTGGITNVTTTFALVGEFPDNNLFEIDGTELKIKVTPASDRKDYDIRIGVNNGTSIFSATFTITISGINTPIITANGGAALYPITLNENIQSVATITAIDADGDTLTYSLFGHASVLFDITQSGMLTFKAEFIPDYENTRDADGNIGHGEAPLYYTNVRVTDPRGLFDEQEVRVIILDVNETPTITGTPTTTVAEDDAYTFTPEGGDDDVGDTPTYSLSNHPAWLSVDTATGTLSGTPTNADVGEHNDIVLTITSGGESATLTFSITVTNINDEPTGLPIINGTPTQGGTLTVDTSAIRDADGLGAFTYQWLGGGNDISGATDMSLVLTQAQVGQTITVRVSYIDGGGTTETLTAAPITTVTNINDAPIGLPTISGKPTQGGTLTVNTAAIRDADGLGTFTYQWLGAGNDISGATDTLLVLTQDEVGQTITVRVSYIDGGGTTETLTAAPTTAVTNVNDAPTGLPTISGVPTQGGTLRVDTSAIRDADGLGAFTYQWQGGGNDISGATDTLLVLTPSEVGQTITVRVSYIDGGGTTETLTAAPTTAVTNVNDAPTGLPTITGTPTQGTILMVNTAAIRDADGLGTFTYQWQGGGNDISGATDTLLVLTQAEVGQTITVRVSYIDGGGTTETLTAAPTTAVTNINDAPIGLPTISGVPTQGGTLRVDTSAIRDADGLGTFTYQWQGAGNDISGATDTLLVLTQDEVGQTITVRVSYIDGGGTTETLTAAPTTAVTNVNDAPTGLPIISGTPTQGGTLRVDTSAIRDADGLGTFTYQWLGAGNDISGATDMSLVLTQAQVGQTITVRVSYIDGGGTTETLTAAPTTAVTNINDEPTGLPTISGVPTQGGTLRVDTSAIRDVDGLGTFTYQWQGAGNDISGATDTLLVLTQAEVGQTITVRVSYIDGGRHSESLTSTPTTTVTNINDTPTISGTPPPPLLPKTPPINSFQKEVIKMQTICRSIHCPITPLGYQWTRTWAN